MDYEADDLFKLWQFQDMVNNHSQILLTKGIELGMTPTVNQNVGQELFILAKSSDNTERTKGKAVYITGSDGNNKLVAYAQANSEVTSSKTIAVMAETISGGSKGFAASFGLVLLA